LDHRRDANRGEVLPIALAGGVVVVFDVVAGERRDKSQTDRSSCFAAACLVLSLQAVPYRYRSLSSADAGR
jgi:hypothetical protein